jgi:hypothetical protein
MVAHHAFRRPHNLSMHAYYFSIFKSLGVKSISALHGTPFVLRQPIVILGIYNSELALR